MSRIVVRDSLLSIILLLISIYAGSNAFAEDNAITVYYNREIGQINKKVFGNSFLGYDPSLHHPEMNHYYGHADYGTGIWDPKRKKPVKEVIELAKEAGLSIVRFPGGMGTNHYVWKNTIDKGREHYLYGIDEFLKTVSEIDAKAVIVVNYFLGNEQDAADLVEYLNAPYNAKHIWAVKRAQNGHSDPYGVKYFEIGNEVWSGNLTDIKMVHPEEYANRYLKYYNAMKAVDPSINIGAVLGKPVWNRRVLAVIRDKLDFGIIHTYPTPVWGKKLEQIDASEVFKISLARPFLQDELDYKRVLKLLREKSGREVPLAITEYNGGFVQDKPVPYRHSLGTALINAELLRIFMKPENNILMANNHHFLNSYWGMIRSDENFMTYYYQKPRQYIKTPRKPMKYIKRPNYYVYELYNKHFGDILIDTDVKSGSYNIAGEENYIQAIIKNIKHGTVVSGNLLTENWQIKLLQGVYAKENNGVLGIDFIKPGKFNYFHSVKRAVVQPDTYYRLSGYIKTEDLVDERGICLAVIDGRGWIKTRSAAITEEIMGTNDWQYVDIVYKTLTDADSVSVIARRIGKKGPLQGKAFFKEVKLEEFIPDTHVPYLSVNASKSIKGDKLYLMVINKNIKEAVTSLINLKNYLPSEKADAWILHGPSIEATNEGKTDNVKVVHRKFAIKDSSFSFTFEPHSFTAIEINSR